MTIIGVNNDDVLFVLHDGNLKHFPAVKSYYYFFKFMNNVKMMDQNKGESDITVGNGHGQ
jgi:hypothetical protein